MAELLKKENTSSFAEFRQSPVTKRWVLVNPGRARRPEEFDQSKKRRQGKASKESCPFCHGNEAKFTPKSLLELYMPGQKEWAVRVVPNKYPAVLEEEVDLEPSLIDTYHKRKAATGTHEVLITGDHDKYTAKMPVPLVDKMLETYQLRIQELSRNKHIEYVIIFQNQGDEAGASVVHPHSQLISMNHVPSHPLGEIKNSKVYFKKHKRCLICDILKLERDLQKRVVMESDNFIVYMPYAARFPFKVWLLPKDHHSMFESLEPALRRELAEVLKEYLSILDKKLGEPAYNYYLHTLPVNGAYSDEQDSYHWHFSIFPRINILAGFEFGAGIAINEMPPEMACEFLKK
ncbi:galactose-1-phosphate uridylyltransferase [Patescibacteria group bacterium]|nr:galactose-1-phosphate uridylyltransferase [Patescibacteria group bacterium]